MARFHSRWQSSLMALAMTLAPLLAAWIIDAKATTPAAPDSDFTPQELIRAAEKAYAAADWPAAEAHLATLVETYRSTPELADPVRRARPLRVTARLRQKKFDAETLALLVEALTDPKLDPAATDELAFWRGLCLIQTGRMAEARVALGDYFAGKHAGTATLPEAAQFARTRRRAEAVLLHAACLLQENQPAEAAAFLAPHVPSLRQQKLVEPAGRAAVLRLHALVAAADHDAALRLVRETQPHLGEITQFVAWHLLVLQLGAHLLESNRSHDAIACFQRVWPRADLLSHQQAARSRLATRLEQARRSPDQQIHAHQLECVLQRVDREIESFSTIDSFDAALRLRVAAAYRDLGRAREAALVLDDMLARLAPDAVVAQASLTLIQCWMQVERWPRAVAAADTYLDKFERPDNPDVPMVRFLKATALHADGNAHEAEFAFAAVHQLHRDHELAPRALFMEGICLLEQDLHREALDAFGETRERFPKSDVLEDAAYWSAMALSFDKRHADAREGMRAYIDEFKAQGRHFTDARFRIAFSTFGLAEYPEAVKQLDSFVAAHPDSPLAAEAHLLRGDALGALGRIDEAIAAYRRVDRGVNARFHEEAVFRIGNVYKVSEQPDALRAHLGQFMAEHPTSQRLAEAVYWIGQSHWQAGRPDSAREVYWQVIAAHGDDAAAAGIEDVLTALSKLYPGGAAMDELAPQFAALAAKARSKQPTLALRARWAKAHLLAKTKPEQARSDLAELRPLLDPRRHHPRLIADCADALREIGRTDDARALYLDLRKWHPRALEKDRAFLGLGLLALTDRKPTEALEFLARFERESLGSPLLAEVSRLKATLFEDRHQFAEAQTEYERLLDLPTAPRQLKAQSLLRLGDLMVRQNQHLKGTAYYERVYVSYGKFRPEVAVAYAKRAAALEHIDHRDAAIEVWRELAERDDLAEFPEAARAVERLKRLAPDWRRPEQNDPTRPAQGSPAPDPKHSPDRNDAKPAASESVTPSSPSPS